MTKAIAIGLTSIALACAHLPPVETPYLTIHFPSLDFFIEGEDSVEIITVLDEGDLHLSLEEGYDGHFVVKGSGHLEIRGHDCNWDEGALICDGIDLTHLASATGGVVLKKQGEFVPVNPLTVVAK